MVENAGALDSDLPWQSSRVSFYGDYYLWLLVTSPLACQY